MKYPHTVFNRLFLCMGFLLSMPTWGDTYQTQRLENNDSSFLSVIPKMLDATPDILPPESNQALVPPVQQTQENSWLDHQQRNIRDWADQTSQNLEDWLGKPDPNHPASASIRVLVDQSWNKYDGYDIKPRVRGRIRLPSFEKRLSVVFGDDRLDDEFDTNLANVNAGPNQQDQNLSRKQLQEDNGSVALRLSNWSKTLPFKTDVDVGLRSVNDLYTRIKAEKTWPLAQDFELYAGQIYRYSTDSKNFWRTNVELTHAAPEKAQLANQLTLTIADQVEEDMLWDNRTFRQHQFFRNQRFNYGIYTGGYYQSSDLRLNSWGPFASWRQPLWREWFYVQADVNYFNDHRNDREHFVSSFLRLETLF